MLNQHNTILRCKKLTAIVLALAMLLCTFTNVSTKVTAAATNSFSSTYYKTNPSGYGKNSTISIDGDFSDWNSSMLIAQGVANDDARAFRGTHEGPVYDTYALYSAWDNDNLYLMWEFTNVTDVVDPAQGYPISDNGKPWNGDIPQVIALDLHADKSGNGMIGTKGIWGMKLNYENGVDTVLCFSSKPGVGTPAIFSLNENNQFSYETEYCKSFKTSGVSFAYGDGHISDKIMGIKKNCYEGYTSAELASDDSNWVNMMEFGHDTSQDTMYEMAIPLSFLGIDRSYLEKNSIGVMHISTFGESGITSIPCDPSMIDHSSDPYEADDSTSAEKADTDVITCDLARVGNGGSTPTSAAPSAVVSEKPSIQPSIAPSEATSEEPSTQPSIAPSEVASEEPSELPSLEPSIIPSLSPTYIPPIANTTTIYYKSNATTYMHYRVGERSWTKAPGVCMEDSEFAGYKKLTVSLGMDTQLTACFNDGNGSWDNNNNANYSFGTGSYIVANGTVKEGIPTVSNNKIILYYKTDWKTAFAHYRTGSDNWTVAPGEQMSASAYNGYQSITIDMGDESTLTVCFNNGSGVWDNNGNKNYYFDAPGVYTICKGQIQAGEPVVQTTGTVSLYYYAPTWSTVNCHFRVGTEDWTAVPGKAMERCGNGYYTITIPLNDENTVTACFNNGAGTWDSKNGSNYYFTESGNYTIKNGAIICGTPN